MSCSGTARVMPRKRSFLRTSVSCPSRAGAHVATCSQPRGSGTAPGTAHRVSWSSLLCHFLKVKCLGGTVANCMLVAQTCVINTKHACMQMRGFLLLLKSCTLPHSRTGRIYCLTGWEWEGPWVAEDWAYGPDWSTITYPPHPNTLKRGMMDFVRRRRWVRRRRRQQISGAEALVLSVSHIKTGFEVLCMCLCP